MLLTHIYQCVAKKVVTQIIKVCFAISEVATPGLAIF